MNYRRPKISAIPFTDRELKGAWRELSALSIRDGKPRQNPHRLMLFYAVECGLKVVWLKRQNRNVFDRQDIDKIGHNLRQLLKDLRVGQELTLPQDIKLSDLTQNNIAIPRNRDIEILHQAWRYGGKCVSPTDDKCEEQLEKVLRWINGELK